MSMMITADEIRAHLKPLVRLRLSEASRAADMRCFHFGQLREADGRYMGEYALHVQCPWRIEGPEGLITGRLDLWEPAADSPDIDWGTWDFDEDENLQDKLIETLLRGYDVQTGSFVDETGWLVVEAVAGDAYGGATITLSGGFRLVIFPAGTRGEDWRIFCPETNEPHFVIAGGKVAAGEES